MAFDASFPPPEHALDEVSLVLEGDAAKSAEVLIGGRSAV